MNHSEGYTAPTPQSHRDREQRFSDRLSRSLDQTEFCRRRDSYDRSAAALKELARLKWLQARGRQQRSSNDA